MERCRVCTYMRPVAARVDDAPVAMTLNTCGLQPNRDESDFPSAVCDPCLRELDACAVVLRRYHASSVYLTHERALSEFEAPLVPETSTFQCEICQISVVSKSALTVHYRKHTGEKPYKCDDCGKTYTQKSTLSCHVKLHHQSTVNKLFQCDVCEKQFSCKKYIVMHMRTHTKETPYQCELCKKRFTQFYSLARHRRIHTGEKNTICPVCGKAFADKYVLKEHTLVHSDEKNFQCEICNKQVKTKRTLEKHLELHRERQKIVCDQCGAKVSSKGNLNVHIKNAHSGMLGYCDVCKKQYRNIKKHMQRHNRIKYFCKLCPKKFILQTNLTNHMRLHEIDEKFKQITKHDDVVNGENIIDQVVSGDGINL